MSKYFMSKVQGIEDLSTVFNEVIDEIVRECIYRKNYSLQSIP